MTVMVAPTRGIITTADLNTDPDVFPSLPGQDFVVEKGQEWSTGIKSGSSGREFRNAFWSSPRWNFKVVFNVLRERAALLEVSRLLGSFAGRLGRYGCFYYFDPTDNVVTDQTIAIGDGVTTAFQLIRTVGVGTPYTFPVPVYALRGVPVVKVNGVTKTNGFDYVVSPWGVIVFTTAPVLGATITYSGSFLFVCRFDTDKLAISQISRAMWSQDGLPFVSLKP